MTLVLAAVAVAQLTAWSQTRPPAAAAAPPLAGTARISGTVKNAADDAPLARARVMAVSQTTPDPHVAITGSDGKYTFSDLPAGAYTVTATRTGFAPFTFGQVRSIGGTAVRVTTGQQTAGIDLPLVAAGV